MTATPSSPALDRLAELGLELPDLSSPLYAYVPTRRHGDLLFVSGQISRCNDGTILAGIVGETANLDDAVKAARVSALNFLARVHDAVGLENVDHIVKLNGYVASTSTFTQQPTVIDGASQLLVDVLGERGRHARTALAAPVLPANALVEIEVTLALKPPAS